MDRAKELLSKEMTRQEFLKTIAMAILAVVGFGNFMSYIRTHSSSASSSESSSRGGSGFGSRKFGG
jgi:uncharacterized membrane protein